MGSNFIKLIFKNCLFQLHIWHPIFRLPITHLFSSFTFLLFLEPTPDLASQTFHIYSQS